MNENKRIIYLDDAGDLILVTPAPECLKERTIEEIAVKDVPFNKPYKIIDVSDLPSDTVFRAAWTVNPALLTDGVGGESREFAPRS